MIAGLSNSKVLNLESQIKSQMHKGLNFDFHTYEI